MENEELPQYMRIAVSVAGRIAEGSLRREKLSGRPSCPRSIRFPGDHPQGGSATARHAGREREGTERHICALCRQRKALFTDSRRQDRAAAEKAAAACAACPAGGRRAAGFGAVRQHSRRFHPAGAKLRADAEFSCRIPQDWPDSGKSLGSLHFWQATGATVVAIGRAGGAEHLAGPYAELCGGDLVIFVGDPEAREAVAQFFKNNNMIRRVSACRKERRHPWFIMKFMRSI